MAAAYVLYNKLAGNGDIREEVELLEIVLEEEVKLIELGEIASYSTFFMELDRDDCIILAGGDGTLNRFVNDTDGLVFENEVLFFPCGTGNDFACDLGYGKLSNPFPITERIKNLPCVTVNGRTVRFLNNVGFGIDGYCSAVGDACRRTSGKEVDYTAIAVKGMLFHFKPRNARVTVDGKLHTYKKVWLAPTMNGRYYGGGMMPTPDQRRTSGILSVMVFHSAGRLKTLCVFPSLFKGTHTKHTDCVEILTGKEITVEFDHPAALQIDGETVLNVTSYTAVVSPQDRK